MVSTVYNARNNTGRLTAEVWGENGQGTGYGFLSMSSDNTGIDVDATNNVTGHGGRFVERGGF
eukprot:SAG22_NODE_304_length_12712_cov_10.515421_7_plen_63_part_00